MKRFVMLLGLTALVALGSDRALTGTAAASGGGDLWQFRLRLFAPEPRIQGDPAHPEAGSGLSIPGFDRIDVDHGRAAAGGQVPLPVRVVRVAIPEGAEVRLETIRAPKRTMRGLRLGPEESPGRGRPGDGAGPTAATGAGEAFPALEGYPRFPLQPGSEPIRLGQSGYFRFQKFVEVIYTPVVPAGWSAQDAGPLLTDVDFYPDVEANLVVTGVDPAVLSAVPGAGSPGTYPDANFEEAYRAAFVNYGQGRGFRVPRGRGRDAASSWSASPSSATTPGAASLSAPSSMVMTSPFASATTPVYRISIKTTGLYRLSQPYLVAAGTGVAPGLAGVDPRTFRLLNHGVEVPMRVVGESDGSFDPADFLEFYGEGLLGEPDLVLNLDLDTVGLPGFPDIYQANDVTDENIYFLFGEPGTRSRIPDLSGAVSGMPLASDFTDTVRREYDSVFAPLGVGDPFFQWPPLRSNPGAFTADPNLPNCGYSNPGITIDPNDSTDKALGPGFATGNVHYCAACDLSLPDVLSVSDPATVRVGWRGASALPDSPDHLIVVQIGSTAANSGTTCFDNETLSTQTFTVPQSALIGAGAYIESPGLAIDPNRKEGAYLDYIEVDYRRALKLLNNELLAGFTNVDRTYHVERFPSGTASDMVVYDISRSVGTSTVPSPRRVTGGTIGGGSGNFTLEFSLATDTTLPGGQERRFAMAGVGAFHTPFAVTPMGTDDLLDPANEADYIVIGHPDTIDLSGGSPFMTYLAHRAADSGLTTRVVMIQDIYNQFNDGIESPEALRTFLAYAFDNWKGPSGTAAPPSYVMLVGDISLDYKNLLGNPAWINQVPTFVLYQESSVLAYFASDNHIASFRGNDRLPDIHLGRVPVRTLAESNAVFQKMLDYDTNPPSGTWRTHGVFIADQGKTIPETGQFESIQNGVADTWFVPPLSNEKLFFDDPNYGNGTDTAAFRQAIIDHFDAGAALTSYLGHGSFSIWGNLGYFTIDHVDLLAPNDKPSFIVNENCLAGGFHALAADALGERFLKAAHKGGIAVFAPAGLSYTFTGDQINDQLYSDLFALPKERRFGPLSTNIRSAISNTIVDIDSYVLLADPAQRLTMPAPRPPTDFTATGGNGQVTLDWNPSPDPNVLTYIYRTTFPFGAHTLITPSGVAGQQYVDTGIINGMTYYYRASSVQLPGPFEGPQTNYNTDCDVANPPASGPDCRWATPLNPNPPSTPAGFEVHNPGDGDRLSVVWNAPMENDIDFYTVSYGITDGGPYPMQATFAKTATGGTIFGLSQGQTYYMVLTATNLSGLTSSPTGQRSGVPELFDGVDPPAQIKDLTLRQSPTFADAVELSWSAPTETIYGGPVALSGFRIYRDLTPGFVPSASNLLDTINDPAVTVYADRNAWTDPQDYYYLVVAVDTRGFASGAGRELPAGISQLTVEEPSAGMIMISWPAVTTDVTGALTTIDHYDLYVDTSPVGRTSVEMLAPSYGNLTTTSITIPDPGGSRFLSVIAVDSRGNKSPY